MFVDEGARRKGVAKALLAHAEAHAAKVGATRVQLLVLRDNAAARALYRREGFEETAYVAMRKPLRRDDDAGLKDVFG